MISVKNFAGTYCSLFGPDDKLIDLIYSELSLKDVLAQIGERNIPGYYIIWLGAIRIDISAKGEISHRPAGFLGCERKETKKQMPVLGYNIDLLTKSTILQCIEDYPLAGARYISNLLGISERTFYRRLAEYNIPYSNHFEGTRSDRTSRNTKYHEKV